MKSEIPSRLHDQIRGVFGIDFNNLIAMVCEKLEADGLLDKPGGDGFAAQVIMLTGGCKPAL